ncbi:MAG: hypothetical protein KIT09_12830 [Bryobacteraceae bacterium]|nr:hypothetical protein [Bryobacteraceae bacterium]
MGRVGWFDDKTDLPIIDEQAHKLETFTETMADGMISKQELERQQASVVAVMKEVEAMLDDAQHSQVTRLLVELSAYNIMRLLNEFQTQRLQKAFGD